VIEEFIRHHRLVLGVSNQRAPDDELVSTAPLPFVPLKPATKGCISYGSGVWNG
jgi:hypothetical protein